MSQEAMSTEKKKSPFKMATDYYALLDVDKEATKADIEKAFRSKAIQWHPDKADQNNLDEVAQYTKVYQDLLNAYSILSDENKRRQYADALQTTDMQFINEKRDTSYHTTDKFTINNETGRHFDATAFHRSYEESRDRGESKAINDILEKKISREPLKYEDIISRRAEETKSIDAETQQLFKTGDKFDANAFNRAFDFIKQQQPSQDVQDYSGEPGAICGGLTELSGLGLDDPSFTNKLGVDKLVGGTAYKNIISQFMEQDDGTKKSYTEEPLSRKEIDRLLAERDRDTERLAKLTEDQFSREPTEIEKMYKDLFQPANVEELAPPAKT
jgi:curved DNA-binding protein CbpA